jgi:hypothetical protein
MYEQWTGNNPFFLQKEVQVEETGISRRYPLEQQNVNNRNNLFMTERPMAQHSNWRHAGNGWKESSRVASAAATARFSSKTMARKRRISGGIILINVGKMAVGFYGEKSGRNFSIKKPMAVPRLGESDDTF